MKANHKIILLTALSTSAAWILLLVVGFWVLIELGQKPQSDGDYILKGLHVPNRTASPSTLILEQHDTPSEPPAEIFRINIPPGKSCHLSLRRAQDASSSSQNP